MNSAENRIVLVMIRLKGTALQNAVERKLPDIGRVSDSKIVAKEGKASINASTRVI